jgi:hypothetical protein
MFQSHYVALYLNSSPFSLLRWFDGRFPMCDVRCGEHHAALVRLVAVMQ